MSSLNASEQAVTDYFRLQGLDHQWIPRTNAPTPDLKVVVDHKPVIIEIKEFSRSAKPPIGGYCPVPFVRNKIRESWRQFEHFSDHTCCLVLYNAGSFKVWLQPELILSAMFGEYFETIDAVTFKFFGDAAMRPGRNTCISAVAGLFPLVVDENCIEAGRRVFQLTKGSRELTEDEAWQINCEGMNDPRQVEQVMRAVVMVNPFARHQLPETLFAGPFDERWQRDDDGIVRLQHSGERVAEMRRLLPDTTVRLLVEQNQLVGGAKQVLLGVGWLESL